MKKGKFTDEEIQQQLQSGRFEDGTVSDPDFKLYQSVFEGLDTPPSGQLSPGFANTVVEKLDAQTAPFLNWNDLKRIAAVIGFFLLAVIIAVPALKISLDLGFLSYIWENLLLILIGVGAVLLIQLADAKLMRRIVS